MNHLGLGCEFVHIVDCDKQSFWKELELGMYFNHPFHNLGSLQRKFRIFLLHISPEGFVTLLFAHHMFHAILVVVRHYLDILQPCFCILVGDGG